MPHMSEPNQELEELRERVAELTQRVYRLEQSGGAAVGAAPARKPVTPSAPAQGSPPAPPLSRVATPAPEIKVPLSASQKATSVFADADLETKIGSQWLNRIGVFALLVAAAYFLKLAFDNGWIGPSGRVAIGLLAGITLVVFANRIHAKGMKYFAYSLAAVGIGVMYLSLWAAFQLFHLVPGGVAFAAMIVVTGSAAMLALRLDAQILAVVALAGGFATPALLSTGQNRPVELFTYILLLDVAAVLLVAIRPWRRLLAGCFIGTWVYYFGWHVEYFHGDQTAIAVGYAAAFFVLFATLPIVRQLHLRNGKDIGWGSSKTFVSTALFNPVIFFIALFATLESETGYRNTLAFAAVALGAFYIVIARMAAPEEKTGEAVSPFIKWLHLAIAIGFLTVAIPLKLEGHWITMAWFVESAILLYVGKRLDHTFLKNAAIVALALGVSRLLAWDDFHPQRLIFNERIATYALALAILGAIAIQLRRQHEENDAFYWVATIAFNALALVAILGEAAWYYERVIVDANAHQFNNPQYWQAFRDITRQRDFIYSGLAMIYGFGLLAVGFWRRSSTLRWQALILIFGTIAKVFLYDLSNLTGILRVLSFLALGVLLMAASFIYQRDWLKLSAKEQA
jgi:uncharacterized membrane protein